MAVLGPAAFDALSHVEGPVVVACSGGADSLALLALVCAAGLDAVAVHVDHGARPGSASDAEVVRAAALRMGARCVSVGISVVPGPSFEARARTARYDALHRAARDAGATTIAVGHTRDDQAETVLLNVLRGAAARGLAGMAPERGDLVRPLLDVPRAATLELCARLGLTVVHDPMNDETAFRRVWIRREVLPLLEAGAGRDLRVVLARQAAVMRSESDVLDRMATSLLAEAGDPPLVATVCAADPALARRAMRMWIATTRATGDTRPPSLAEVDAVMEVVAGTRPAANLGGGDTVVARGGHLHRRPYVPDGDDVFEPVSSAPCTVAMPGSVTACGLALESWIERAAPLAWPDGRWTCVADADAVGADVTVRIAQPGERFRPLGMVGTKRVATARAEAGVDRTHPSQAVVVASVDGEPLWVVGYRIADRVRVTSRTRRYLWISAAPTPVGPPECTA